MLNENGIGKSMESSETPTAMSNSQGKIFTPGNVIDNKYVVLEFIGKGAFGEVYRAYQLNLQRDVAIKVVSHDWLRSPEVDEEEIDTSLQRFRREVQAMARVRHPNVLQVYDHGSIILPTSREDCPVEYIVMEYIPGETMRHTMSEEGFYPEQDLLVEWLQEFFLPILDGVEAIHALEIIHRDLKPENILLDGKTPKIADFGLARSSRLKPVTQSMEIKGTAHYMSPEHFFDFRKADQRADIYSLGKILFEAVTGKIGGNTIPFKSAALPEAKTPFFKSLDNIIQHCTAENKEERLKTVGQLRSLLLDAIARLAEEQVTTVSKKPDRTPILRHPAWIWTGVVVALASVAAMTLWHLFGEPGKKDEIPSRPGIVAQPSEQTPSSANHPTIQKPPAPTVLTEDGSTLHFIPGGKITSAEKIAGMPARQFTVKPFYMDETRVTNHQYVEFLNHHRSQLTVKRGVVRMDDEIWLILGKIYEGYEPVVFKNGEFKITNATYTSLPVLRVTANGAAAYARFYNRRLPTFAEWLYALGSGILRQPEPTPESTYSGEMNMESMHSQMQVQPQRPEPASKALPSNLKPAMNEPPNQYGIRGLDRLIKEWGLWVFQPSGRDKITDAEYVVLPEAIVRQPWEAFAEVGFRCVREVNYKGGS